MTIALAIFYAFGLTTFILGLQSIVYYPLALIYELRRRKPPVFKTEPPLVSVVVPAYNEEKVIGQCIESILASEYQPRQIIVVDDGSTDGTLEVMRRYENDDDLTVISKPNGGKASALNAGLVEAEGEVILFVDADGIFARDTIARMLEGFDSERVGAVCGHDSPLSHRGLYPKLATLQAHVSTGFVRRALSVLNCLPIVSGNIGAFRRETLDETGPFLEDFVGEDLELTFRVHKAGYQVRFQPSARVLAECPSTLAGLWKQRIRWTRGFVQTVGIHRRMVLNPRYRPFSFYLGLNAANMLFVPLLQLASFVLLPVLIVLGTNPIPSQWLGIIGWLGLGFAVLASIYGILLDRDWGHLKYLYIVPLWVPYSVFIDLVIVWSFVLELRGARAEWHKITRRGAA